MPDAIAASREAFAALKSGGIAAPPRVHLVEDDRTTLLMGAAGGDVGRREPAADDDDMAADADHMAAASRVPLVSDTRSVPPLHRSGGTAPPLRRASS